MKRKLRSLFFLGGAAAALATSVGCHGPGARIVGPPPKPLGAEIDQMNQTMEVNAEAAKFIVYMHEFELNDAQPDGSNIGGIRLNAYGEDHVKQIAFKLKRGAPFPVVVERSQTSIKPGTEHLYPIHFNEELDAKRREVVVAALATLGVPNADEIVVVAPSFAEGINAAEAARAYNNSLMGTRGAFGGNFGTFFGGFGGFGGFGLR